MIEEQKTTVITSAELLTKVGEYHKQGFRLVQICCAKTDVYEINYSFDKDYRFENLRIVLPDLGQPIPSVSGVYWAALLYENEMADLFGVKVKDMALDFKGNFYRTSVKWPFSASTPPAENGGIKP